MSSLRERIKEHMQNDEPEECLDNIMTLILSENIRAVEDFAERVKDIPEGEPYIYAQELEDFIDRELAKIKEKNE